MPLRPYQEAFPLLNLPRLAVRQGGREGKSPFSCPPGAPVYALVLAVKAKPLRGALRAALTAPGELPTHVTLSFGPYKLTNTHAKPVLGLSGFGFTIG